MKQITMTLYPWVHLNENRCMQLHHSLSIENDSQRLHFKFVGFDTIFHLHSTSPAQFNALNRFESIFEADAATNFDRILQPENRIQHQNTLLHLSTPTMFRNEV